jgi:hypothetical protein
MQKLETLRKCRVCGLEAFSTEDLKKFRKASRSLHGHNNLCKVCQGLTENKGGKYWPLRIRELERRKTRRIMFKGIPLTLQANPRTNICSKCGRKYPEDLKRQTVMHHEVYDKLNPLSGTLELCVSCHMKLHYKKGDLKLAIYKKGNVPWNKRVQTTLQEE